MRIKILFPALAILLCMACNTSKKTVADKPASVFKIEVTPLTLFDSSRSRAIPVDLYSPVHGKSNGRKLVILSHGYNANQPGAYKQYQYIANHLASEGYFVACIQHELPTDSLLPMTGIPQIVRKSNWERGVVNILFVLNEFKEIHPELDYKKVILIGHSNGGDMSMLFAQKYPSKVDKVISLDNRRVALPRTKHPSIYSIRSSDQPADDGVLPGIEEAKKYGIKIVKLPNTIHNDMDDDATDAQKKEINDYIDAYLRD